MRSELNVTQSKKWKAEAFGDQPFAFVSRWLLRCRVVTWPRYWYRVTWLDDLPVDGREVVTSPVSVKGGALPGNVDDFRYPTAEPISLLVEDGDLLLREWVSALVKVVTHWRGAAVVHQDAFAGSSQSHLHMRNHSLNTGSSTLHLPVRRWELCPWGVPGGSRWCCTVWGARTLLLCRWFCRWRLWGAPRMGMWCCSFTWWCWGLGGQWALWVGWQ